MRSVGFQGLRGAYSEMAILQAFEGQSVRPKAFPSFDAVFAALTEGSIPDALLPIENSMAGLIHENLDGLDNYPVHIVGEEIFRVQHCLLVLPGTSLRSLRTVISHPQALAQCGQFLRKKGLEPRSFFDTAGAAQFLAAEKPPAMAAIASAQAAKLYGLEMASQSIADSSDNLTRFLHLKRQGARIPKTQAGDKERRLSMLALRLPGGFPRLVALSQLLQSFGLPTVHCEARPSREEPWQYVYFLEIAGGPEHPQWKAALAALGPCVLGLKVLGSYGSNR